MGNPFGRSTIVPLTNKSGGSVAAGDFVYIDTANNDAFTTGTTSGYTKGIGIAQATIASNAIGLVLIDGYAALVNVNASVTRGNFLKGYTVAKQGTDAGSSRASGTCGMFLTGGTTPDALIWQPDLGAGTGAVSTDSIWDAAGDLAVGTGADTAHKLAAGSSGQVLVSAGAADPVWKQFPLLAVQHYDNASETFWATLTTPTSIADFDATNAAVTFTAPASGNVLVRVWTPYAMTAATVDAYICLRESTSRIASQYMTNPAAAGAVFPLAVSFYLTGVSAGSHTYKLAGIASSGNLRLYGGNGASGGGVFIMEVWAAP